MTAGRKENPNSAETVQQRCGEILMLSKNSHLRCEHFILMPGDVQI